MISISTRRFVGPLTSLVLAGLFWLIQVVIRGDQPSISVEMFGYLAWINVALVVFNLIPGFALDGGRLLRAFGGGKAAPLSMPPASLRIGATGFTIVLMILGGLQIFAFTHRRKNDNLQAS